MIWYNSYDTYTISYDSWALMICWYNTELFIHDTIRTVRYVLCIVWYWQLWPQHRSKPHTYTHMSKIQTPHPHLKSKLHTHKIEREKKKLNLSEEMERELGRFHHLCHRDDNPQLGTMRPTTETKTKQKEDLSSAGVADQDRESNGLC